jgi:eukaryotic-like serine/threonine-protein kinase
MSRFDPGLINSLRDQLLASEGKDSLELEKGTVIGEDYVVGDRINDGGTAVIYKCHRRSEPSKVFALKISLPKSANAARRFQAEVMSSYQVRHPNVLRSIDCMFHGKALAYIMEYAPGGDLRDVLESNREIPISTFIIIAKQLASGLGAIHEKEIVHRDIKPENVLFSADGQIKIADFGISFSSEVTRITSNGSLVGTINYMAPEYVKRGIFDPRSDLFSLGVMLYELLTHKHPYGYSRNLDELLEKFTREIIPVENLRDDCPVQLSDIIMKLLAMDPEYRYESANELFTDLIYIEQENSPVEGASILPALDKARESEKILRKISVIKKVISFTAFILTTILLSVVFLKYFQI